MYLSFYSRAFLVFNDVDYTLLTEYSRTISNCRVCSTDIKSVVRLSLVYILRALVDAIY